MNSTSGESAIHPGLKADAPWRTFLWGLVHLAEAQPGYPSALAPCVPPMLGPARDWATTLHYRLLNADEGTRRAYGEAVAGLDAPGKGLVRGLLADIAAEDPARFGAHAAEVLAAAGMPTGRVRMPAPHVPAATVLRPGELPARPDPRLPRDPASYGDDRVVSHLLPTRRWGMPAYAGFEAPVFRRARPVQQGPASAWWAYDARTGRPLVHADCRVVPFPGSGLPGGATLHDWPRDDAELGAAEAAFAATLELHALAFLGTDAPPPDPEGFRRAFLGAVHPASWPWYLALAPADHSAGIPG